jgi:protoporphyrin/coproporphyrin ferrochelatase
MKKPIGVLVMAYGGPNSLDEIPGYLADIRSGRPTPTAITEEIRNNYRQIGGKSPLLEITRLQMQALGAHLKPSDFNLYLGMRHWAPWIEETVRDMLEDGISQAISIVLAPHFSKLSVAKYQTKIAVGLKLYHGQIEFTHIESYYDAPGLIHAFTNRVKQGLERWTSAEQNSVRVIFSAHSLPVRIQQMGDPYVEQLHQTARLVAESAGLDDAQWSWSYQSAGRTPEPWLGPQLPDHLRELARQGVRNVISVPVGFVSDHVEILYDIDIQAQEVAKELGMRLERPPALNDDPLFIQTLADIIRSKAKEVGWLKVEST